jgi:hypothetical protein
MGQPFGVRADVGGGHRHQVPVGHLAVTSSGW